MNAYPIGNDLTVKWSLLYSDGSVFPLSNYDYEFSYRTNRGHKIVTDTSVISVEENILTWTFKSDEQVVSGRYTLCLKITLSGSKVIELQYDNAFMLSPLSGFKGAGSEIVIQSYCDAIDLKDAVLQARKAMDLAADAVIDTANSAADAKAAKEAAEVTSAQAKADATSAMAMAMEVSGKVAVAEQAATNASRDAAAAQQAAQTASNHITSLEQAISELPDGQAVSEKVAEHTTKLSELEGTKDTLQHELMIVKGEDGAEIKGYGIVSNSYVLASNGTFADYNGWSRTDYIPIDNYSIIEISGFNTSYNWFYDENKNPLAVVNLVFGQILELSRWPNAKYIVLSESDANMANLVITAYGYKNANLTSLDNRVSKLESYDIPAILESIPKGYKFGGVVTPNDAPQEDALSKFFYIAKENGIYTNFGGVEVQNEVAILYKIDGSVNILPLDTLIPNKYVDQQGNLADYNGWTASQKMDVEVGTSYKVVALVNGVWTKMSSVWFAFYNANGDMTHRDVTTESIEMVAGTGDKTLVVSWDTRTMGETPMVVPGNYTPTNYIMPDVWQKVTISKLDESAKTEIVLPSKLAFVQDKQFDMMVNNILYRGSAKNVGFKNYGSPTLYAYPYQDRIRISQPNEVVIGNASVRIQLIPECAFDKNPAEQSNVLSKSFAYRSVLKTQGSGVTKKVMFIGDSITANGIYPNEVKNLFDNDDMSVQLIGTLGTLAKHEGRGGWSAEDYCTKSSYNDYTNAFYNPSTNHFDFSYYMSNNNFDGVDYVFISLGINDVFKQTKPLSESKYDSVISYYNEMITSIRAYDASIKIFVGLPILPANSDWALSYNADIIKAERLGLIQRLIQEYDGRESEGFVVVPLYCVVDTERDFPTESRPICARDSSTVEYVTDQTHPKTQGYYKIADVMYTYIKYGTTLS